MSNVFLLCFVLAACAASSKPVTPPASPTPAQPAICSSSVAVLFQIDRKAEPADQAGTSELSLACSGAWTYNERSPDGAVKLTLSGTLAEAEVAKVIAALDGAAWTQTRADATCDAYSPQFIEYRAFDKLVWTQRLCGPDQLDADSRQRLERAHAVVDKLVPNS